MVNQIEYLNGKNVVDSEMMQRAEELRNLIYWQRRSFDTIRERTAELRQALEARVRKNTAA
jgi:chaperonin cofactor prefoldin